MRGYWNDDFLGNRIELDLAYVKKTNEGSKFFAILGWIQRKSNVWYKSVIFSNLLLSYNSVADNEKKGMPILFLSKWEILDRIKHSVVKTPLSKLGRPQNLHLIKYDTFLYVI